MAEEGILDIALKTRWEQTSVEVITVKRMREETSSESDNVHQLIREFLEKNGELTNLQVFIDELPLSSEDMKRIEKGEESEVSKTIQVVMAKSDMAWISLSTSSLLETLAGMSTCPKADQLERHLLQNCPGFKVQKLGLSMRNSGNISKAAAPEALWHYMANNKSNASVLSAGQRSTVPGPKPNFVLRNWKYSSFDDDDFVEIIDKKMYKDLSKRCLPRFLGSAADRHTVVLCGIDISPKKLTEKLLENSKVPLAFVNGEGVKTAKTLTEGALKRNQIPLTLYDGGVNTYDERSVPSLHAASTKKDQKGSLKQWLTGSGGVLVTHNLLFCGMEADVVIMISKNLNEEPNLRSGLLRAVAGLVFISGSGMSDKKKRGEIEAHFDCSYNNFDLSKYRPEY